LILKNIPQAQLMLSSLTGNMEHSGEVQAIMAKTMELSGKEVEQEGEDAK
jgi:hypothetical protein